MKSARLFFAAALASLLAACADTPGPVVTAPPPPVASPPAQVALADSLVQQAAAYRGYVDRAASINAGFTDGTQVASALRVGVAYEPRQFLRGAVAYAAIAALQDRNFVASVRSYANTAESRRQLTAQIIANPAYALSFPGADNAAALAMAALHNEGLRIYSSGRAVKQAAYDTQRQAWSRTHISGPAERLAHARTLSGTLLVGDAAETSRLHSSIAGVAPLGVAPAPGARAPYGALVARAVSLAALAAIGQAGEANLDQLMPTLTEPEAAYCLNMAKLNTYQCLAVSRPHYEDMFCLGQHILMDTGACLIRGSGAAMPLEVRPPAIPVPSARPTSSTRRPAASRPRR